MENSAICVFFLIKYDDSVDMEREINRLAISFTFSSEQYLLCFILKGDQRKLWLFLLSFCQGVASEEWLGFCIFVARSAYGFHCQVAKMDEAMCSVQDTAVVSHEKQTYNWPGQNLHYGKVICNCMVFEIKFFLWPWLMVFLTGNLLFGFQKCEDGRFWRKFENFSFWVNLGIYC